MASEINISCSAAAAKGGAAVNSVGANAAVAKTHDMAGTDMGSQTQAVGTAFEALEIPGDVSPVGFIWLVNLDTANNFEISFDAGVTSHLVVRPGHRALFQPKAGVTVQVKFITSAGSLAFVCAEE